MRYIAHMTWPDYYALDRATTVIFIAISPLEEHGPHLPIGTDLLTAIHLAEAIGYKLETEQPGIIVVIAPPVPLGVGVIPMPGTVNITGDVVLDVAVQIASAFARDGFRYIVFANGHMGAIHLTMLENAARIVSRRYHVHCMAPVARIIRDIVWKGDLARSLDGYMTAEQQHEFLRTAHSGMLETSVMLAAYPDLVKPDYTDLPPASRRDMLRWRGRRPAGWLGYQGNPSSARSTYGQITIDTFAEAGAKFVRQVMVEGDSAMHDAHILPRFPFWIIYRRLIFLIGAIMASAGLTWVLSRFRSK
jgi:creatinine amidohydrolase